MFGDIPDGKGTFQDYKNIDYRNSPTGPKCFMQNVFGDVLDRK